MIIVSACLIGINCKYNGKNNYNDNICEALENENFILVCPECMGGLQTPRVPSEIKSEYAEKKVINKNGEDVTNKFSQGAKKALDIALKFGARKAILKSCSPSCGYNKIYDGTFSGKIIEGNGIFTELLLKNGIEVISSDEYENDA